MSKAEQDMNSRTAQDKIVCPRCKSKMECSTATYSTEEYSCPECGLSEYVVIGYPTELIAIILDYQYKHGDQVGVDR